MSDVVNMNRKPDPSYVDIINNMPEDHLRKLLEDIKNHEARR